MSNLQAVQAIYQAFGTGNIPGIVDRLADDVEWEHDSVDHGIPWLKPGRGKPHVLGFFGIVGKDLEISKFDVRSLLEGGSQVVALIGIEAKVRSTGKSYKDYEAHVWTFNAQGKVSAFRHLVDTHQHLMASKQ